MNTLLICLITFGSPALFGQVNANSLHAKYGPPVKETFGVRPGITLTVTYDQDHHV